MMRFEDCERLAALARRLLAERKRYNRMRDRALSDSISRTARQKLEADLNWAAMEIEKMEITLHVACVDAGLADRREPQHYEQRYFRPSSFHTYTWQPPLPRSMQ